MLIRDLQADRRPRLSAKTLPIKASPSPLQRRGCCLTGCYLGIYKRTDEGVCPYFVIPIWLKRTIQTGFREALLPLGEAGRGFHSKASVPTLWHYIQPIQQLFYLFTHLLFYLFQFLLTRQLVNSSTYTNPDFGIKGTFPNYHPLATPLLRRGWAGLRTLQ